MDNAKTKKSKKILAIILIVIFAVLIIAGSVLLIVYIGRRVRFDESISLELREGCSDLYYNTLNDNQQKMYRMICNEAQSILDGNKTKSSLGIYKFEDYGVDKDEAIITMYAVKFDCPAYFIISNDYIEVASSIELKVYPEFSNKKNRQEALAKITSSVQDVQEILSGVEDDVLKFKLIYDYVMLHTSYKTDENGKAIHNGYTCSIAGVLGDEKYNGSICQGYANTLSFLCNYFGVDCAYVDSPRINHALNIVKIEDEWYYADATSDDNNDKANYSYFLNGLDNYWKDVTRDVEDSNKYKMLSNLPTLPTNRHDKNFTVDYLDYYIFDRTTCTITNCSEDAESIVIPSDLYGMTVKRIEKWTFEDCDKLKHIEISDLISRNDTYAFSYCNNLTSVKIADGVKSLAEEAFANCTTLKSVELPSSLEGLGVKAFYGCSGLQEINIPQSVTIIDSMAFSWCRSLTKLQLHDNLKVIDDRSFEGCSALTDLKFPHSLESIEYGAFMGCGFKNLDIPISVESFGGLAFADCVRLESIIIRSPYARFKDYSIFGNCPNVKSATIPMDALWGMPKFNLQNVVITNGEELYCTFADSINLLSIELPSTLTYIADNAFLRCLSLTNIKIPSSVTYIGRNAFSGCSNLQSIKIPDGVTSIEEGTFSGCYNLVSVELPASVVSIGELAFSKCYGLREINLNNVTSIDKQAFENCYWLSNIEIDSIQSIGEQAFSECKIRSILIPISAVDVGRIVFYGCGNMTIYCEADSKPDGWDDDWCVNDITQFNVVWGYKNF